MQSRLMRASALGRHQGRSDTLTPKINVCTSQIMLIRQAFAKIVNNGDGKSLTFLLRQNSLLGAGMIEDSLTEIDALSVCKCTCTNSMASEHFWSIRYIAKIDPELWPRPCVGLASRHIRSSSCEPNIHFAQ
jgi:hypothetical protein